MSSTSIGCGGPHSLPDWEAAMDRAEEAMRRLSGQCHLQKTEHLDVFCSILPHHWRSNKSLPAPFVILAFCPIPDGTRVCVSAGNDENFCADVKNCAAEFNGQMARFSDLRFVGKSGRGKNFNLSITIFTQPHAQFVLVPNVVKVTVDGPRDSRNASKYLSGQYIPIPKRIRPSPPGLDCSPPTRKSLLAEHRRRPEEVVITNNKMAAALGPRPSNGSGQLPPMPSFPPLPPGLPPMAAVAALSGLFPRLLMNGGGGGHLLGATKMMMAAGINGGPNNAMNFRPMLTANGYRMMMSPPAAAGNPLEAAAQMVTSRLLCSADQHLPTACSMPTFSHQSARFFASPSTASSNAAAMPPPPPPMFGDPNLLAAAAASAPALFPYLSSAMATPRGAAGLLAAMNSAGLLMPAAMMPTDKFAGSSTCQQPFVPTGDLLAKFGRRTEESNRNSNNSGEGSQSEQTSNDGGNPQTEEEEKEAEEDEEFTVEGANEEAKWKAQEANGANRHNPRKRNKCCEAASSADDNEEVSVKRSRKEEEKQLENDHVSISPPNHDDDNKATKPDERLRTAGQQQQQQNDTGNSNNNNNNLPRVEEEDNDSNTTGETGQPAWRHRRQLLLALEEPNITTEASSQPQTAHSSGGTLWRPFHP